MQSMSTTGTSTATQAVTTLDEQTTPAADSAERPLTTADRCDVCDAQAYVRVVMLTGELFFCAHHARAHSEAFSSVATHVQDETDRLLAEHGAGSAARG